MNTFYKPQGYTSVSPYPIVEDASWTIEFLAGASGGVELRLFPDPQGRLLHVEVRIPDTVVMIADNDEGGGVKDPGGTTWWIATKVK